MMLSVEPVSVRTHSVAPGEPIGGYAGTIVPFYLADREFITGAADAPAHTPFQPRVEAALKWERAIPVSPLSQRRLAIGYGEIELQNGDGYFDTLVDQFSVDGRRIVVRAGVKGWAYSSFETLFEGTANGWRADDTACRLRLRDLSYKVNIPLQENLYKGTGALEGGDDLRGRPKPWALGDLSSANIPAILVDPIKLIYQVSDGPVSEIFRVYDRALELPNAGPVADILDAAPSPATYVTELGRGYFRLGSVPAGLITCDLHGDNSDGFAVTAPDIALRILLRKTDVGPAEIDGASFQDLKFAQPANVGYWFGTDQLLVSDALDACLGGVLAWWGCDRLGGLQVGRLDVPGTKSAATFTDLEIIDIQRLELPAEINPLIWRARIGYQPNYAVQATDIAGAVTTQRRQFLLQPFRISTASNEQRLSDFPQAKDPDPIGTTFALEEDANKESNRLMALFGVKRNLYRLSTKIKAYRRKIGETVTVQHTRYGLAAGKMGVIVGLGLDAARNESSVIVLI